MYKRNETKLLSSSMCALAKKKRDPHSCLFYFFLDKRVWIIQFHRIYNDKSIDLFCWLENDMLTIQRFWIWNVSLSKTHIKQTCRDKRVENLETKRKKTKGKLSKQKLPTFPNRKVLIGQLCSFIFKGCEKFMHGGNVHNLLMSRNFPRKSK